LRDDGRGQRGQHWGQRRGGAAQNRRGDGGARDRPFRNGRFGERTGETHGDPAADGEPSAIGAEA
jgi:hypothetical protein